MLPRNQSPLVGRDVRGNSAMIFSCAVFAIVILCLFASKTAVATDCPAHWVAGESFSGVDGGVYATTEWTPPGSDDPLVIVAGAFSIAGDLIVSNIAGWDRITGTWHDLGGGTNLTIRSLLVHEGDLIAAGLFTMAGDVEANYIARFDGTAWHPVGGGMDTTVWTLAEFNGEIVAGGFFTEAGGVSASRIARFDGTAWHPIGEGFNAGVESLAVVQLPFLGEETLLAGGRFTASGDTDLTHVAAWIGSEWLPLGSDLSGGFLTTVLAFHVHEEQLYIGGRFTHTLGYQQLNHIARLQSLGQWAPLGSGVWYTCGSGEVRSIATFDGDLIATGKFETASGLDVGHVARWDGASWHSLGTGLDGIHGGHSLTVSVEGDLILGGTSFWSAGGASARRIARWDGQSWSSLTVGMGIDNYLQALVEYKGEVVVGGTLVSAGGQVVNRVARRDASSNTWQPLGSGVTGGQVYAMAVHDGDLIVGGSFTKAGGATALRVARWDGEQWHAMSIGPPPVFGGGRVHALRVYNGELYAGGQHHVGVSRWTGSGWEKITGSIQVWALAEYDGMLVAGGGFTIANGGPGDRIAAWDGTTWHTLDGGVDNTVRALTVFEGDLIAGGAFTAAGKSLESEVMASRVARWDGASWHTMGAGMNSTVLTFTEYDNRLVAGGMFTMAGGDEANYLAHWNGDDWQAVCNGVGDRVLALLPHNDALVVGGMFHFIDGQISPFYAQWTGPLATPCIGDLNGDGVVNVLDVLLLLQNFGSCPPEAPCLGDLNGDGVVDQEDLFILIKQFGPCE